jgi:hypothetical protein
MNSFALRASQWLFISHPSSFNPHLRFALHNRHNPNRSGLSNYIAFRAG